MPQGTVGNNQGPDRLEAPMALEPNHCKQPTLCLQDPYQETLTMHGTELHLFGANDQSPYRR